MLERATNFSLAYPEDLAALDATIKYGSKFTNWRKQSWVNPLLSGNIAIHFNNRRLKDFVVERMSALWPRQFSVLEADVQEIQNYADHVTAPAPTRGSHDFDYVVDCMGTPASFDGYTMSDCTLMDRCRIHTVKDYEYEPFTDHIATRDGWMFGVPLAGYKTYGYLYSQAFTPPAAAEEEMKRLLGAKTLEAGAYNAQYAFRCYYANELVSGRVCKNGNRALFFEPLLANSMFLYIYAARLIYDYVAGGQPASHCNGLFVKAVQEMEDVISYYYRGGSTFDTEVWRARRGARERPPAAPDAVLRVPRQAEGAEEPGHHARGPRLRVFAATWQIVDEQMGYHSFDSPPAP